MVNQQMLEGNWNRVKGEIRREWGSQVSENELDTVEGKTDQLVGLIQQKTGETRERIERFLNEACERGETTAERARAAGEEYARHAAESISHAAEQAAQRFRRGYSEAEDLVHRRPAESMAVAFGSGLIAGVIVGLFIRGK